jgi:Ca-activated chloride channel family protein
MPSGQVLNDVRGVWDEQRKRARVQLLIDVSGSMDEPANGGAGISKMELAKQAARDSLAQLADTDEVGLTIFTDGLEGRKDVPGAAARRAAGSEPPAARHDHRGPAADERDAAVRRHPGGVRRDDGACSDEQHITGVVLLTDGRNEYNGGLSSTSSSSTCRAERTRATSVSSPSPTAAAPTSRP